MFKYTCVIIFLINSSLVSRSKVFAARGVAQNLHTCYTCFISGISYWLWITDPCYIMLLLLLL
ncbi:hypothetical protein C1646_701961 [Rhizophagus diaphanus]|nr:hypothetical protein C1646_701961 [Rhizophagus diaphanus] [Rhizophagus sp. MUCL 43196]